jgi:hypothetical protein
MPKTQQRIVKVACNIKILEACALVVLNEDGFWTAWVAPYTRQSVVRMCAVTRVFQRIVGKLAPNRRSESFAGIQTEQASIARQQRFLVATEE